MGPCNAGKESAWRWRPPRPAGDGADACPHLVVADGVQLGDSIFKDHGGAVDVQEFFLPCAHLKL